VNLDKSACDTIVQKQAGDPSVATQWQVMTSNAALSGDVLFIKGAFGEALNVSVGASYEDRGIRRDCHDFFGVTLSIPMFDKNPRGLKRQHVSPVALLSLLRKNTDQFTMQRPRRANGRSWVFGLSLLTLHQHTGAAAAAKTSLLREPRKTHKTNE